MYVSIPPKESVAKIVGRIKGKSSLMLFDRHPEYRDRYGRHFWARGYYCETVGNVYILKHELNHYIHHDLWFKAFGELISIIYWWNPIQSI